MTETTKSPESAPVFRTTVRLPLALHTQLRVAAATDRRTVTDIIEEALVAWLARREQEGGGA